MTAAGDGTDNSDGSDGSEVAHISERYDFDAPAEVVFSVLTDPDRTTRWLPRGMHTESHDARRVRVRADARTYEYAVDVVPGELRLRWRSLDIAGLRGGARVEDAPAGGSVVHAEVAVPAGTTVDGRARDLLAETMGHLRRDVDDNFNAG